MSGAARLLHLYAEVALEMGDFTCIFYSYQMGLYEHCFRRLCQIREGEASVIHNKLFCYQ